MKLKELIKSLVIVFCFIISCSVSDKSEKAKLTANQITIIFKFPPPKWKIDLKAGGNTYENTSIRYIDDNFIPIQFFPDPDSETDTLIIKTKRKLVELSHSFKGIDELSYIFQNGDTVMFHYKDKTPIASVLNRKTKPHDVNLDLFIKDSFYPNDYSSYIKYRKPSFFIESYNNYTKELEKVVATADQKLPEEMNKEMSLVDSLYKNNLISDENYNISRIRFIYQKKIIELFKLKGGPRPAKRIIPHLTKEDFNIQLGYNNELGLINGGNILDSQNDSMMYFGFHKYLIDWIYFYSLSCKVGTISSTYYKNGIADAGGSHPNYISLYDSIQSCSILSEQAKNILKFETIQKIIENQTIDEAKKAFNRFKDEVHDTALIGRVDRKYSMSNDIGLNSDDINLNSFSSENITFNSLLKKQKGRVIFLDFWSSACPPCIKQFEYSKKLKESYRDKDLIQIYISIEPDKETWEKACRKLDLIDESYFVINRFSSKQLENMNIQYIPHYMIYDKNGNLVTASAPRPDDKSLTRLLDKYLGEK